MELMDSFGERIYLFRGRAWRLPFYLIVEHFGAGGYRNPVPKQKIYFSKTAALRHFNQGKKVWELSAETWPNKTVKENFEFYNRYKKKKNA